MPPAGWLSPWISESRITPDLLAETGYNYTLNWCHDDRPVRMATRKGSLWSIPYPQELNDLPMMVGRHLDARDFADMIIDQFDEMLEQANRSRHPQALVMGIALHPYLVGQPYRLRHLRRALQHIAATTACHAAVKANYPLTYEKMTHILDELRATAYSTICPHGRPVMLRLTRREIEKNFDRI